MTKRKKETIREKFLKLLRDGKPHCIDEFHEICRPSSRGSVYFNMAGIRKYHLHPGEVVVTVYYRRRIFYQMFMEYKPGPHNSEN